MDISLERYRKRRALLILMLVPLLALGLWNLRALRHPAGTPVSPQETTAHHVILVPLDGARHAASSSSTRAASAARRS